ncbi:putative reverse transcriptase domain-containing protein [Tanacetum coccineum]
MAFRSWIKGYDELPIQPVAPPSSDYIPCPEDPQIPPVPQDEDEREPMFIQPHDLDYVSEPIYPEYILLEDEHVFPVEEQPLPPVVSPTIESPGYVTESDPEEDPEEYEDDETEDSPVDYLMDEGDEGENDDSDSSRDDADDDDEDEEEEEEEEEEPDSATPLLLYLLLSLIPHLREQSLLYHHPPLTFLPLELGSLSGFRLLYLFYQRQRLRDFYPCLLHHHYHLSHYHHPLQGSALLGLVDAVTAGIYITPTTTYLYTNFYHPPIDRRDDIPGQAAPIIVCQHRRGLKRDDKEISEVGNGIRETWVDLAEASSGDSTTTLGEDARMLGLYLRNVQTMRPYFYADFMKCQPLNFKGTEGVVGLTKWIEKMESVFNISGCAIENQVKFATCTLLDAALTYWNGQIRTLGPDAYSMTWEVLKKKITDKYCPQCEIKKLEVELWNLKVKGNDVPTYNERFQELTLICTKFVANETEKKGNGANPKGNGCFECGALGHFKRDCPKLKNKDGGNGNAQGWMYAVGNAEKRGNASGNRTPMSSRISAKKEEDKSEGKQLKDVPIVRDFPEVFPEDLSGLPLARPVEFQIAYSGALRSWRLPYRLAPPNSKEFHVIDSRGIHVDPAKIESIKDWASPKTPTEICQFLGLAGYYRRFIEGFSKIAKLMTKLTQKGAKFDWGEKEENAF